MSIPNRLSRLEAAAAPRRDQAADAAAFVERMRLVASRFPEEAAAIPLEERLRRMSSAEHLAWTERFMAEPVPVFEIIRMHEAHRTGDRHATC